MTSREIRFRQWEPISQKFTYWGCMGDGEFRSPTTSNGVDLPTVHQQMTGLKDKNGKEIYEGDIVKGWCSYDPEGKWWIGSVIFETGAYTLDLIKAKDVPYMESPTEYLENDDDNVEVIGNIYQNKELLNDQQ